jgi:hypothetical protein
MTLNYDCSNKEALVGYLYEECEPGERDNIAAHVALCARCAEELAALRATRGELAAWTPPETQLGFRIVTDSHVASGVSQKDNILRPARWWQQPLPAWAQAAAAVVIFAAGAGLGALRSSSPEAPSATTAAVTPASRDTATVSAQDLAALEQRLRAELQQASSSAAPQSASSGAPLATTPTATLQQVRALIAESEQRQQKELTLRTAEVIRDFDTQRRGDLARIQQTFGRLEGTTAAEVEQQRQTLNYLMRVSQTGR